MKIALILNKFPVLSETFIMNQVTGLINLEQQPDIFAIKPRNKSVKILSQVEKYQLLKKTTYFIHNPHNKIVGWIKALLLLAFQDLKHAKLLIKTFNGKKYGHFAASLVLFYQAITFLKKGVEYDIIHCHYGPNGLIACYLREISILRGKILVTFHGYDLSSYLQKHGSQVYNHLFQMGDLCLVVDGKMKEKLTVLGCPVEKVDIHRQGIDTKAFSFCPLNFENGQILHILSIGRLVEKKGFIFGLEAIKKLVKKYPKVKYTIIGEGTLKLKLEDYIKTNGLDNIVIMAGSKTHEEVYEYLCQSHILLAPSITGENGDMEGIPNSIKEGLAIGLIVLGTNNGGIPEIISDGKTGWLVPEKDIQAIADKLIRFIENRKDSQQIRENGRNLIEQVYDMQQTNIQLLNIYEQLAKK